MTHSFSYAALDQHGAVRRGAIAAQSPEEAVQTLRAQGLSVVHLRPKPAAGPGDRRRGLGQAQLAEFLFLLAQLIGSGSNLSTALGMLRAQQKRGRYVAVIETLQRRIASGESMADAFAGAFGQKNSVSALIAAGEVSGDVPGALRTAATQLERDQAMRAAFWSAVSYPLFILATTLVALLIILAVVVPSLEPLVADANVKAGTGIRVLIALSHLLTHSWPWLATIGVSVVVGGMLLWRVRILTPIFDRFVLDGALRALSRRLIFGRTIAVLGRLMAAGVPAPQALKLSAAAVQMDLARARLEGAAAHIYEGLPMSQALGACKGMPPVVLRMAEVGEQSGGLGALLERAGDFEQSAALRDLQRLAKWLGPMLIVALGGLIGTVMASLLATISGLGSTVLP